MWVIISSQFLSGYSFCKPYRSKTMKVQNFGHFLRQSSYELGTVHLPFLESTDNEIKFNMSNTFNWLALLGLSYKYVLFLAHKSLGKPGKMFWAFKILFIYYYQAQVETILKILFVWIIHQA